MSCGINLHPVPATRWRTIVETTPNQTYSVAAQASGESEPQGARMDSQLKMRERR